MSNYSVWSTYWTATSRHPQGTDVSHRLSRTLKVQKRAVEMAEAHAAANPSHKVYVFRDSASVVHIAHRTTCDRCQSPIIQGDLFCAECGIATGQYPAGFKLSDIR